jgi:cysteine desulfurase
MAFLSLSGHKIHAPKGVGVLYVRNGTPFHSLLIGGHQEKGRRAGTENVPSIVALGKACELAVRHLSDVNTRVRALRDRLETEITKKIPQSQINGDLLNRTPNTTNIGFDGVEGEAILLMMNEFGICASSGSACTSGSLEPSHVLRAMQVPAESVQGAIRFSLSVENTEDDINTIIKVLPPIIAKLRAMSPFWKK